MSLSPRPSQTAQRRLLATTVVLGCSLFATPAFASTATVASNQLTVNGGAAENNSFKVRVAGSVYTVEDTTASISAGSGCVTVTANKVTCTTGTLTSIQVNAGDGNDVIDANTPVGSSLLGEAGDDTISSLGAGADTLAGGDGIDTVDYSGFGSAVQLSADALVNDGPISSPNDVIGTKFERLVGSSYNDTLTGGFFGVRLEGGVGNDTLTAGSGGAALDGGVGADTLTGSTGTDEVDYSARTGHAVFNLPSGNVTVYPTAGGTEVDTLSGAIERYYGTLGGDSFTDIAGAQSFFGGQGNDSFTLPNGGDDYVDGGYGVDDITDGPGNDVFVGGDGNDEIWLVNSGGSDVVNGGNGTDIVNVSLLSGNLNVSLDGNLNDGNASLPAELDNIQDDNEQIVAGSGNDTLTASTVSAIGVKFTGGGGNDTLTGGAGPDVLTGGTGTDVFSGNGNTDDIQAKDGNAETVNCGGATNDTATVDLTDTVTACEFLTY